MDGSLPLEGKWNFDSMNRNSIKKLTEVPEERLTFKTDDLSIEVMVDVEKVFPKNVGKLDNFNWAVTHRDAKKSFMGESMQINEAPYQVLSLDGNILTAVPKGGEQAIKMDITGWVLEFGQMGPVLRQPKSANEKDRSLPPGSQVDVQGIPRIIGTPERG